MSRKRRSPSRSRQALLILDMLSEYEFPDGPALARASLRPAQAIARLKRRAVAAGVRCIYVNDTRDRWESDQHAFVRRCLAGKGGKAAALLKPTPDDFLIFKPRHSAFYGTPLSELLDQLGVQTLVLTGSTSHQCVLFSAADAHVRNYDVIAPADCIVAPRANQTKHALFILSESLNARTARSTSLRF